ncbi:MAG: hypothetical protein ABIP35_04080 [Ginsengibacter sp.]
MKLVEILLEIFGWLQIVAAVTIAAGIIALGIYLKWDNELGEIISVSMVSIGLVLGIVWATRIWIKYGTIAWLSRIKKIS